MTTTRIETEQRANAQWVAYVVRGQCEVASGSGDTEHEAVEAARRAYAEDLDAERMERDEEAALDD